MDTKTFSINWIVRADYTPESAIRATILIPSYIHVVFTHLYN